MRLRNRARITGSASQSTPFGYDVVWVIGQSNAVGWATRTDATDRVWPTGLKQYARKSPNAGTLIDPFSTGTGTGVHLEHGEDINTIANNQIDAVIAMCRIYAAANGTARPLLIVPSAAGTTGFYDGHWSPGDTIYERELARLNAAMALYPGNRLLAIYWAQGESDANTSGGINRTETQYATDLDAMIDDIRSRATQAATAPFLVASMVPGWAKSNYPYERVQFALAGTKFRKPYVEYVDADNPSSNRQTDAGTGFGAIHYTALDYRGADGSSGLALKAYNAIAAARARTTTGIKEGTANGSTSGFSFDSSISARYLPKTGIMNDWSGNARHATKNAGDQPKIRDLLDEGQASLLDGSWDTSFTFPSNSYSVLCWAQISNKSNFQPFVGNAGNANILNWHLSNSKVTAGHNGSYTMVQDSSDININQWYHFAVTYDSATTTMKLYRNGSLVATNAAVAAPSTTGNMRIGRHATGGFNGRLDNIITCNRALTLAEVNEHIDATKLARI